MDKYSKEINSKELKDLLSTKEDFQVIDVRSKSEWGEGHINDSRVINIEVNSLLFDTSKIDKSKKIFLICESGGRSSYGTMILSSKGYNAVNVLGGMSEFRKLK